MTIRHDLPSAKTKQWTLDPMTPTMRAPNFLLIALAAFAIAAVSGRGAIAGKPDLEGCRKMESERDALLKTGIQADIERGAEWGSKNLPADRLREVLRFIHVDEQVRFRCVDAFARAAVAEQEAEAKRIAAAALKARLEWEARQKEMLKNIPPPQRNPKIRTRKTRAATNASRRGIPPLPVRRVR